VLGPVAGDGFGAEFLGLSVQGSSKDSIWARKSRVRRIVSRARRISTRRMSAAAGVSFVVDQQISQGQLGQARGGTPGIPGTAPDAGTPE
jgi:hypothetical protein